MTSTDEIHEDQSEEYEDESESVGCSDVKKSRVPITLTFVLTEISQMKNIVSKELDKQMKSTDKNKSVRFLRSITRRLDSVEKHIPKIKKERTPREN